MGRLIIRVFFYIVVVSFPISLSAQSGHINKGVSIPNAFPFKIFHEQNKKSIFDFHDQKFTSYFLDSMLPREPQFYQYKIDLSTDYKVWEFTFFLNLYKQTDYAPVSNLSTGIVYSISNKIDLYYCYYEQKSHFKTISWNYRSRFNNHIGFTFK